MTNTARSRGTAWNTAIVDYLIQQGWPHAERRALNGNQDKGDVSGVIGVMIEAKAEKRLSLAEYIEETLVEQANAGARVGVAWIKRRGKASAGDGYVVMTGAQFTELLKEAGY